MNRTKQLLPTACPLVWLALLGGLAVVACARWAPRVARASTAIELGCWDIPRLVDHLRARGVPLHMVSTIATAESRSNMFLTTRGQGFDDCNTLPRSPEAAGKWRGVVYCEINQHYSDERPEGGAEDWYLRRGHFCFFGDPDVVARIEAALRPGS
jgi:hypothetical protein